MRAMKIMMNSTGEIGFIYRENSRFERWDCTTKWEHQVSDETYRVKSFTKNGLA